MIPQRPLAFPEEDVALFSGLPPSLSRSWRSASLDVSNSSLPTDDEGDDDDLCDLSPEDQAVLDDFSARWSRKETLTVEVYLELYGPVKDELIVDLVYREFCLAELDGLAPAPEEFLARYSQIADALKRLLNVHAMCNQAGIGPQHRFTSLDECDLPEAGQMIDEYVLRRELGRGTFARVFLAEQADLENRLVVVKISTRPTREPWLLARARHAQIVEIISHAKLKRGAFQLIAMPFLGGATLSAILNHRGKIQRGRAGRGDLLKDLDVVAAPEYAANTTRPTRLLLGELTEHQALAWIVARLAEGLDHAYSRDVAHGDVKPSNILLTADGNPMLLDFNLAQDWSQLDDDHPLADPGGTLAYMAPERIRAIAANLARAQASPVPSPCETTRPWTMENHRLGPHLADVYSLGLVLLEAVTSTPPSTPRPLESQGGEFLKTAADYAEHREQGASFLIREAERKSRPLPAGLRVILENCLSPDPSKRYRRALELAEDLDRWRQDRLLAYAKEPFLGQTVPRWIRRKRKFLIAAGMVVVVGIITSSLVVGYSRLQFQNRGLLKLTRYLDEANSPAFPFQRPGASQPLRRPANEALAVAVQALHDYDVLSNREWWKDEEVANLPADERDDLELWLMEQALRYCRIMADRPGSPGDWLRAQRVIDQVDPASRLSAFKTLRERINRRLCETETLSGLSPAAIPLLTSHATAQVREKPRQTLDWLNDYLLGIEAELDDEMDSNSVALTSITDGSRANAPKSRAETITSDGEPNPDDLNARKALAYHGKVLARDPDSFWAHYRSAVIAYRLQDWSKSAGHLDHCLRRRPANASLRGQYAACLTQLGLLDQALVECNRALATAPDYAEFYRTRAFILASKGQARGLSDDLQRFELLSQSLGRFFFQGAVVRDPEEAPEAAEISTKSRAVPLETAVDFTRPMRPPQAEPDAITPEEIDVRSNLATILSQTGATELRRERRLRPRSGSPASEAPTRLLEIAEAELGKILAIDPNHFTARAMRMMQLLELGRYREAGNDLDLVLNRDDLGEILSCSPTYFDFFIRAADRFGRYGRINEARRIADTMLSVCMVKKLDRGKFHYCKARVLLLSARTEPEIVNSVAEELYLASRANSFYKDWYRQDVNFHSLRSQIDLALTKVPKSFEDDSLRSRD